MGKVGGRATEVTQIIPTTPSRDPSHLGLAPMGGAWESNFSGAAGKDCIQAPWPLPSTFRVSPGQVPWGNKIGSYGTHIQIFRQNEEKKFP